MDAMGASGGWQGFKRITPDAPTDVVHPRSYIIAKLQKTDQSRDGQY
jgi:hypothetical protein